MPHLKDIQGITTLANQLLEQWPAYLSYVISFFSVGIVWANHHTTFTNIVRSDHTLRMLNLFLLMTVTLIPFTTALLAEFMRAPDQKRTAAAVYAFVWVLLAVAYNMLWEYAVRNGFAHELVDPATKKSVSQRDFAGLAFYVIAFLAAFFSAELSVFICLILAVYYLIPRKTLAINTPKS